MDQDYDLVVIGSGPAGQKAAINASKLGRRVAVIERAGMVGGVSVHSGTIPSKTLRDAILYLTGFNERSFYGQDYRLRERISSEEIASRVRMIVTRETNLVRSQFNRNRVAELDGTARFLDPHTLEIDESRNRVTARLESGKTVRGAALLYSVGRQGNTDVLNLPAAGLEADARGRLKVNDFFQTAVSHIYAAGDVIGFPALAGTSMEQGRLATTHMFGAPIRRQAYLLP